jgi:cation diffusion facilitator CzcD-associated flavoprotein CzcO
MSGPDLSYDIIIVGAGISGVNFAYRLQQQLPHLSYAILEGRDAIGGTWDLFRYPGIRSDSDLYTFGFPWRPWRNRMAIAEGHLIVEYIQESASAFGIDKKILFGHRVNAADWSSTHQQWSLDVSAQTTDKKTLTCRFLIFCTGYYVRAPLNPIPTLTSSCSRFFANCRTTTHL